MIRLPRYKFPWTPENCAKLVDLSENTKLTYTQIGKIIGCGKNAAIGKAHRLGLTQRGSPIKPKPVIILISRKLKMPRADLDMRHEPFHREASKLITVSAPTGPTQPLRNHWPVSGKCLNVNCKALAVPNHLMCYQCAYIKGLKTARAA